MKRKDYLEDIHARWKATLIWIIKKVGLYKEMDWSHLAQDMEICRDIVNVQKGLRVP
jgi:hypothetical protein